MRLNPNFIEWASARFAQREAMECEEALDTTEGEYEIEPRAMRMNEFFSVSEWGTNREGYPDPVHYDCRSERLIYTCIEDTF